MNRRTSGTLACKRNVSEAEEGARQAQREEAKGKHGEQHRSRSFLVLDVRLDALVARKGLDCNRRCRESDKSAAATQAIQTESSCTGRASARRSSRCCRLQRRSCSGMESNFIVGEFGSKQGKDQPVYGMHYKRISSTKADNHLAFRPNGIGKDSASQERLSIAFHPADRV